MKSFEDFIKEHANMELQNNAEEAEEDKSIEEFDKAKTKVLKYVLYKKRTQQEVKQKFCNTIEENLLENIIQNLKENGYLSDNDYIERAVNEFMAIKTLSRKEMRLKLFSKGISSNLIDTYFNQHQEQLEAYEIACAKKIILKKQSQLEKEQIEAFLYKKGYSLESIKSALEELAIL